MTLGPNAVDSAIRYLIDRWPNHPMTAAQREAWVDILVVLEPDELRPALAKCPSGGFRPDPEKVLDAVVASRPRIPPSNDMTNEHPDGPAPEPDQDLNHRELDRIRTQCNIPTKYRKEAK